METFFEINFKKNEIQSIHFIVVDTRPITFTLSGTQFVNHRDRLVYRTYDKEVGLVSLSHVTPPWLITKPKIYTFPTQGIRLKPTRPNCVYNPVRFPKSLNVVIYTNLRYLRYSTSLSTVYIPSF